VGRREATGRGVAYLAGRALDELHIRQDGATAIVQGFGNVGSVTALNLAHRGLKIVGISDHSAAYFDRKGLDVQALVEYASKHRSIEGYSREARFDPDELLLQRCDVLVPAAVEQVITENNAGKLQCRVLAEGANGPTTPAADEILAARGAEVFVIPDILCNAGGVIASYFEWVQDLQYWFWTESEIVERLQQSLEKTFRRVLQRARTDGVSNRDAALAIGIEVVQQAKRVRGLFP